MADVNEKYRKRFEFLNTLYELTDGNTQAIVDMREIGQAKGFSWEDTQNIVTWLQNEGLLGECFLGGGITISHWGIKEVESALRHPDQETAYFPPINIINVQNMINSQLQQATVSSTQTYTQQNVLDTDKLRAELEKLKNALNDLDLDKEKREESDIQIQTIETQLKSKKPITVVIEESAKSLRNLLEGTMAGIIASGIVAMIPHFPH